MGWQWLLIIPTYFLEHMDDPDVYLELDLSLRVYTKQMLLESIANRRVLMCFVVSHVTSSLTWCVDAGCDIPA